MRPLSYIAASMTFVSQIHHMKKLLLASLIASHLLFLDACGQSKGMPQFFETDLLYHEVPLQVPETFQVKTIRLSNNVQLEYAEKGDPAGMVVILLHGLGDSWRSFENVLPLLPDSLHVFSITQRGHGNSDRPSSGYRPEDFAYDVSLFMEAHHIRRAVIVGHSMGGAIAQCFVINYPEKTSGLILIGALAAFPSNPVIGELQAAVNYLTGETFPGFAREFQKSTMVKNTDEGFLAMVTGETLKVPVSIFQQIINELVKVDYRSRFTDIKTPTLLIWGDRENFVPYSDQELMQSRISGAHLTVYAGSGHGVHWDEPGIVATELAAFIRDQITQNNKHQI